MNILILGHKGMLGHMVLKYFKTMNFDIETTDLRWPSDEFKNLIKEYNGQFIINCIGAIHQRTSNFDINWELPIFLDFYSNCKIIHPGTDCEIDNDNYGISKKIARDFIVNTSNNTKSIKTSILGPELNTNASLMEWFLSNHDNTTVSGYSRFYWNGNTTLTWAEHSFKLMKHWDDYKKETILSSECISKKEILESLNQVFNRNIIILDNDNKEVNKCLLGEVQTPHISIQLKKLKDFYYV